jgi:hypothetical protein
MKALFYASHTARLFFVLSLGLGLAACDSSVDVNDTPRNGQPKAPQPQTAFTIAFYDDASGHTFDANGAIDDAGHVEDDNATTGSIETGAVWTGQRVLLGVDGILVLAYDGRVDQADPLEVSGSFAIIYGGGAYGGLEGSGTFDRGVDAVGDTYEIYRGDLASP